MYNEYFSKRIFIQGRYESLRHNMRSYWSTYAQDLTDLYRSVTSPKALKKVADDYFKKASDQSGKKKNRHDEERKFASTVEVINAKKRYRNNYGNANVWRFSTDENQIWSAINTHAGYVKYKGKQWNVCRLSLLFFTSIEQLSPWGRMSLFPKSPTKTTSQLTQKNLRNLLWSARKKFRFQPSSAPNWEPQHAHAQKTNVQSTQTEPAPSASTLSENKKRGEVPDGYLCSR